MSTPKQRKAQSRLFHFKTEQNEFRSAAMLLEPSGSAKHLQMSLCSGLG